MTDLSALGTHFDLFTNQGHVKLKKIDLALDGNPLEISAIQSSRMELDLNGKPITYTVRRPYEVSIALIPGSASDVKLRDLLYASRKAKDEDTYLVTEFTIYYPSGYCVTFFDGLVTEGMLAAGVSSDGRLIGGRYKMSFAGVNMPRSVNKAGVNIYFKYK